MSAEARDYGADRRDYESRAEAFARGRDEQRPYPETAPCARCGGEVGRHGERGGQIIVGPDGRVSQWLTFHSKATSCVEVLRERIERLEALVLPPEPAHLSGGRKWQNSDPEGA